MPSMWMSSALLKAGMQQADAREWGNNTPLEMLASALSDLHQMDAWLQTFQRERVKQRVAFLPSQVIPDTLCLALQALGDLKSSP